MLAELTAPHSATMQLAPAVMFAAPPLVLCSDAGSVFPFLLFGAVAASFRIAVFHESTMQTITEPVM